MLDLAEMADYFLPIDGVNDNATDTQSVIESIAGDAAATTIVTVDHLEVSVELDDPERPPSSTGSEVAC